MDKGLGQITEPGKESRNRLAFRFYIHDSVESCRLQLIGHLTEANIPELRGCWSTARTTLGRRRLLLDLYALNSVDEAGKQWLASMAGEGGECHPPEYLRDLVAGKHTEFPPDKPTRRVGVIGRVLAFFRGVNVEAAK